MNSLRYQDSIDLPDSGGLVNVESYSGSTSSAYDEVSPNTHDSTPVSHDCNYEKNHHSTNLLNKTKTSLSSHDDHPDLNLDILEKTITEDKSSKIKDIIALIMKLTEVERMILMLRFPRVDNENLLCEPNNNELHSNVDINGNCSQNEHTEALTWVTSHLEENKSTCLQKQEVYDDYKTYCISHNIKCLSTADFGKVMKKVFPNIKARRLGARGQSRYCYSGLRNRHELQSPMLSDVTASVIGGGEKRDNSEVESYASSATMQTDLSHLPEYDLGANIVVDSALVVLDFIRKAIGPPAKNATSIKQAVKQLLMNNHVETHSPHALRLMSIFQQSDVMNKTPIIKKTTNEPAFSQIKKEETLASPCSAGTPQRSSTASPMNIKRRNMLDPSSPTPSKVALPSDYYKSQSHNSSSIATNNSFRNNLNLPYYPYAMRTESILSGGLPSQKSFVPTNFSTPVKNPPIPVEIPNLDSPLLDRNPTTTKKLELSNSKVLYHNNNNVNANYSSPLDRSTIERSMKHSYYNPYATSFYDQHSFRKVDSINVSNQYATDYGRDLDSPLNESYQYDPNREFNELEKLDTNVSLRHNANDDSRLNFSISSSPLNKLQDYDLLPSNYGQTQSSKTAKIYLNTPPNSPGRNEYDPVEYPRHQLSAKHDANNIIMNKSPWSDMYGVAPVSIFDTMPPHFNISSHLNPHHHHQRSDESSVSSTTNAGLPDQDGHPSTTVPHHRHMVIYK